MRAVNVALVVVLCAAACALAADTAPPSPAPGGTPSAEDVEAARRSAGARGKDPRAEYEARRTARMRERPDIPRNMGAGAGRAAGWKSVFGGMS
jgi:hypothetical protein